LRHATTVFRSCKTKVITKYPKKRCIGDGFHVTVFAVNDELVSCHDEGVVFYEVNEFKRTAEV
jgi:hypothetical protein